MINIHWWLILATVLSSTELSGLGTEEVVVMGLSKGNELLYPSLRDHGSEGLRDADEVVVGITDYGVQVG